MSTSTRASRGPYGQREQGRRSWTDRHGMDVRVAVVGVGGRAREDEWPGRAVGQRDVNSERASPSRARPASEHGGGGWREGGETASRSRRRVCVRECTLAGFGVLIYCADIKGQPVRSTPRSCTGSSPRRCLLLVGGTLVEWLAARLYQVSGSGYVHNNDCRSRRSPARRE